MDDQYDVEALLEWRVERDEHLRSHYTSPIPEEHLPSFAGLRYFEPDPAMMTRGRFTAADGKIDITSSTGGVMGYELAGHVTLTLGDESVRLAVLRGEEDDVFIPFRDATSGVESYGGGRYVPAVIDDTGEATVDFNRTINPFCAYDEEFSCPLPPHGNWLTHRVAAGEQAYEAP